MFQAAMIRKIFVICKKYLFIIKILFTFAATQNENGNIYLLLANSDGIFYQGGFATDWN